MASTKTKTDVRLKIPLPEGDVAVVPLEVLQKYVDKDAAMAHGQEPEEEETGGRTRSLVVDETGISNWHTDWELGMCMVTDASGFPMETYAWHNHPLGTEYAELYEG